MGDVGDGSAQTRKGFRPVIQRVDLEAAVGAAGETQGVLEIDHLAGEARGQQDRGQQLTERLADGIGARLGHAEDRAHRLVPAQLLRVRVHSQDAVSGSVLPPRRGAGSADGSDVSLTGTRTDHLSRPCSL